MLLLGPARAQDTCEIKSYPVRDPLRNPMQTQAKLLGHVVKPTPFLTTSTALASVQS